MHLGHLSLVNFKNYENAELSFSSEVNCLVGNNGSGKTNVLDAIYYLSYCKGYFNPVDSQNIKHEEQFFLIQGEFEKGEHVDKIHCAVKRGQKKKFSRNKKDYERLADHFGLYPAVMIAPNDTDLIREGSDVRRKFMDRVISQYSRAYLDDLIQYNKVLLQRNNLLKFFGENRTFDADNLEVWDEQLTTVGGKLFEARSKFVAEFISGFNEFYQKISGGVEEVSLAYKSDFQDGDFHQLLQSSR
ncbi:MAG: DNA replication/repair protein RecF, partial [Flavobacteriales bacterium]